MADKLDNSAPFDDDQGTRIAKDPTGAGAEATVGTVGTVGTQGEPKSSSHQHESGYGGKAGEPRVASDVPTSRR